MLVYVLHPMMIVLVRGAAKLLRVQKWLVENSLVHFIAVAALSAAVSAALTAAEKALRQRIGAGRQPEGRAPNPPAGHTGAIPGGKVAGVFGEQRGAGQWEPGESIGEALEPMPGRTRAPARKQTTEIPVPDPPAGHIYAVPGGEFRTDTARAWAQIDLEAIAHNARALQKCLPRGCRLMAVVKADAYGHGAPAVAGRLWRMGVRAFAVATLEEGAALRRCGVTGEILILGYTSPARVPELLRWRLSQTAADAAHAAALAEAARGKRRPLPVHIAVDTGMHRLGVPAENIRQTARLLQLPGLDVRGLFTHLAVSDSLAPADEAFTRAQLAAFAALLRGLRETGCALPPVHALASGGILNYGQLPLSYARAGIALYGAYGAPGSETRTAPALTPALSLHARVVSVRTVPAGACAGYGRAFCAARRTTLAVVSIGYADGVPRALGEGCGTALLRGARVPIVGRVCMDQLFVDATDTGAAVGDVVTLIGRDGDVCITAGEAAAAAGTIANELLCRIGARTARFYSSAS